MDMTRQFPVTNDPLGETLHQLRLHGSLYCRSELSGDWSIEMPKLPGKMMFHIITAGQCWLQLENQSPKLLKQGALVLVTQGQGHIISSDLEQTPIPLFNTGIQQISERYEVLKIIGEGEKTELTCGVMGFDQIVGQQLIQQLPSILLLDQLEKTSQTWLNSTLEFISAEARQLKPGGETIITNLADILIIQLIRHWMEQSPKASQGWLGALKDKRVGIALHAIHQQPGKNWTVDSLAQECNMSRSGFSARFSLLVGCSVKSYLTKWRMNLAYQRLKHKNVPLIELAEELGYNSEAAFSRAFKRVKGFSPTQHNTITTH
ncbi:MAG: AraC family transcriptional regulator [Oceanospirillaceae bacterium]|nr:AraC family transcriptional regulator [Oceanospirillaceae bacterium]